MNRRFFQRSELSSRLERCEHSKFKNLNFVIQVSPSIFFFSSFKLSLRTLEVCKTYWPKGNGYNLHQDSLYLTDFAYKLNIEFEIFLSYFVSFCFSVSIFIHIF